MDDNTQAGELPELPDEVAIADGTFNSSALLGSPLFTADQMRTYAAAFALECEKRRLAALAQATPAQASAAVVPEGDLWDELECMREGLQQWTMLTKSAQAEILARLETALDTLLDAEPAAPQGVAAPATDGGLLTHWHKLNPPTLELGRTYKTRDGSSVTMMEIANAGKEYESMADQYGHHRYSRSHGRIIGRVTGSTTDDPGTIVFAAPAAESQPVAEVPIHPRNGPLWANVRPLGSKGDVPTHYLLRPLRFADEGADLTAEKAERPAVEEPAQAEASPLVTMVIRVGRDGVANSDVQTHNNSYAEVALGLGGVRAEIERVFVESEQCPYHPSKGIDPHEKIHRATQAPQGAEAEPRAWEHEDGERVISKSTMASARRDGGAMLSSVAGYTRPLYYTQAPSSEARDAMLKAREVLTAVRATNPRAEPESIGALTLAALAAIDADLREGR